MAPGVAAERLVGMVGAVVGREGVAAAMAVVVAAAAILAAWTAEESLAKAVSH